MPRNAIWELSLGRQNFPSARMPVKHIMCYRRCFETTTCIAHSNSPEQKCHLFWMHSNTRYFRTLPQLLLKETQHPRSYNDERIVDWGGAHVEAGSNSSPLALRVVGDDEKDPSAWGYNWATLFLGHINTGTWPSRLGEPRIWDSKMLSHGTRTRQWLRWRGPAAIVINRSILSS
jgi:hypothetical protein